MADQIIDKALAYIGKNDLKIVEAVSLGTITANQSGAFSAQVNVSSSIPTGYKLAAVVPTITGNYGVYYYFAGVVNAYTVDVVLMRASGSVTSINPKVTLICIKA